MSDSATSIESSFKAMWNLPLALVIVLVAGGLVLTIGLYWSERGNSPGWLRGLMAMIRFSLLILVLWMLAGWNWLRTRVEPPELVLAIDVSDSMATVDGSALIQNSSQSMTDVSRLQQASRLLEIDNSAWQQLQRKYRVRFYAVADDAMPLDVGTISKSSIRTLINTARDSALPKNSSRLGDSLNRIIQRQTGRGTAAIVFLSDGIATAGSALSEAGQQARRAAIPIHAISLGRQTAQSDLRLSDLLAESQVFLGDRVSIEAKVIASDVAKATSRISLIDLATDRVLDQQSLQFDAEQNQQTVTLGFVPAQAGLMKLKVAVDEIAGEGNKENNRAELSLQVENRTIKVLLVFGTANYEFRFLKHYLERTNESSVTGTASYQLKSVLQDSDVDYVQQDNSAQRFIPSDSKLLDEFDAYVFGEFNPNLIPRSSAQAIVRSVTHGGAGCVFIAGHASAIERLSSSPLYGLLPIESVSQPKEYERWQFMSTKLGQSALPLQWSDLLRGSIPQHLPMLETVMKVDRIKPAAQVLAEAVSQQGARVPLLISQFAGAGRTMLLATDETYRWTGTGGSDLVHQHFWGQTLRWISRGKLSSLDTAELSADPKQSALGTPVRLRLRMPTGVELPESVTVLLTHVDGQQGTESLARLAGSSNTYQASIGQLAPGNYRAVLTNPVLAAPPAVEFHVIAPPGEQANLRADIDAMAQLAQLSRGRIDDAEGASDWFEQLPDGKPTRLGSLPPQPIWNHWWIALIFVVLISSEWLLRRYARML